MALVDVEGKCLLEMGVEDGLVRIGVNVLVRRCICT